MHQPIQFVGVDLHQDTVTLAVLPKGAPECRRIETMANDPAVSVMRTTPCGRGGVT